MDQFTVLTRETYCAISIRKGKDASPIRGLLTHQLFTIVYLKGRSAQLGASKGSLTYSKCIYSYQNLFDQVVDLFIVVIK